MFKKITFAILVGVILAAPGDSLGQRGGGGGGGGRGGGGGGGFTGFNRSTTSQSNSIIVGTDDAQITLIPYPEKNWIIARAPAEVLKQIEEWIIKLDLKETAGQAYDTITVSYVDVDEVASRLNEVMSEINVEIQKNIFIQPLVQSRQLLVFGKDEYREMVKKLVTEIDLPSNQLQRRTFKLKYADPEDIKTKLDELYNMTGTSTGTSRTARTTISRVSTGASVLSADTVITTTYPSLRQVVILASPDNLEQIRKQIADWDIPIDPEALKPRIIELKNVDPSQMADLLTQLFSESSSSSSRTTTSTRSVLSAMYGTTATSAERIIGPLYGQLTFADVPGTKKIIVISNIPEAYEVVEALIKDLDEEEMAEVPTVVELKFADPERLCEVLNAMFCEAGSSVEILRSASGLGEYSMDESSSSTTDTSQEGYSPWWSSAGARTTTTDEERPISNVIGKIRFVPETRTKSVLILSPPEFIPKIEELIARLDVPGKQVMIKAVIVEVDHQDVTSLGIQLASNANAFGSLNENAILALNAFEQLDQHGSAVFGAGGSSGTETSNTLSSDVYGLLDFLQKKVNAKILNQQSLWTEDNEEASFFKGQRVAFYTAATTGTGTSTQNFEFQRVGMNLAVRPSITPTKDVDMIINIIISQLTTDEKNSQPVRTEMETKTNMIVGDGQTLMLGGILFQQDGRTKRGVPILSDIPIAGVLFSHYEKTVANNELLVFITPYVIDESGKNPPATQEQIDTQKKKLDDVLQGLNSSMERFEEKEKK
jgi:general secretion pathway protein D